MSFRDDAWRDSYDEWKLASPPEYEEEQDEASQIEEDAWRDGCPITREEAEAAVGLRRRQSEAPTEAEIARSQALIGAVLGIGQDDDIPF